MKCNAIQAIAPHSRYVAVWAVCRTSANVCASVWPTPYNTSMLVTAKCQGPAPFGVGTSTAMLPATKQTSPAMGPTPAMESMQKNAAYISR